ncbi:MAG: hypothetical protein HKN06_05905 [Gammaproteobacteria bacterium]|nr:hypothetical protein [Gammaproteobacteria bacterium]
MVDRFEQDLQRLAADYRGIRAPAELARRISAGLPEKRGRRSNALWLGLAAAGVAALVLLTPGTGPLREPVTTLSVLSLPAVPPTPRLNFTIRSPGLGRARLPVIPPTPRPAVSPPATEKPARTDA